ncbi:X-ray radiation resistance-associated protein 1 [Austrofundulus limnaeus]|uniref:X-ray radiation resistance-associated protein 1 n=1 Tax=Austrofundulus limnaeus TaxID=52670 RepID=A0A2I4C7W9_AUSLI|nr:PREDICTED: X-ray radiation resistance-associated protein 1 [Austrofundulus limnaeus]
MFSPFFRFNDDQNFPTKYSAGRLQRRGKEGSFCCFKSLRELSLALNGICDVTFDAAEFPHLKVLDLSFNHVSAQGLVSLTRLPRLQTLHLTGNQLHRLPPTFGSSDYDQALLPGEDGARQFEALEVLMLDNNKLTFEVFHSLTNFTKLKYVNLQGNRISAIPLLKVGDSSKLEQLSAEDEAQFHSNMDEYLKIMQTKQTEDSKGCSLPLPELQHLNLAENKFSTEEDLIGAALFPKLSEMIIHSNPLITKKRGLPMLTYYLQERRGIEIKRNKEQNIKNRPLKWKVEENFRTMSKKPCLTDTVCPRGTQNVKYGKTIQETTQSEGRNSTNLHNDAKHFFITQGEDKLEFELMSSSKKKETTENKQRNRTSPKESTINKTLQSTEVNPDVLKSVGIQTAVRMLEHRLRNLNVYRDSKPKLDSIQTPYRQREKKIKELPPVRPKNRSSQKLDETIKEIKASTAITVTPLAEALGGKGANRKEAQSLLKNLQIKHQMLFEKAWALTEQS